LCIKCSVSAFPYFAGIPLKEEIGDESRGIGGETEGDFMDNSVVPRELKLETLIVFGLEKWYLNVNLFFKIIFRICHLLVYMVVVRYQTSLIQLPLSSCWI
jgi:hypothetical protein